MDDLRAVIMEATDGHAKQMAGAYGISGSRMYEILGKDNPLPKAEKMLRALAPINPAGCARLFEYFDRLKQEILPQGNPLHGPTAAELYKELNEAFSAKLEDAPRAVRLRENSEAIAALEADSQALLLAAGEQAEAASETLSEPTSPNFFCN